jgi:hypothetical protein
MKVAIEQVFDGSIPQVAIGGAYDSTKINRGKHTGQFNLGSGQTDKFIGPAPVGVGNFGESALAIPSQFTSVIKINDDLFWVFGSDAAATAPTRRIQLWTFVPSTNTYTFIGAITLTFPTATNHTVRGLKPILTNYTTGTVEVSGTAVTGSGTVWNTGLSVGSRIGFGSTNPDNITTWYQISAIGSDTSITLTGSAGTISAGTSYVIQDLMIITSTTNATATNAGLFLVKGLRFETFTNPSTTIPAATTVDKIRAVYWLKDAATITHTGPGGAAPGDFISWTEQYVYITNGGSTTTQIYRYNFRAPLTPTSGAFVLTGTNILITGTQTNPAGNLIQLNNGVVATLNHGSGSGVESFYYLTTTRIVRVPLSNIVAASTTFIADSMSEVTPGGSNTNATGGTFHCLDYAMTMDKLVVVAATTTTSATYITDYYTGGQQIDRRAGCSTLQLPSSLRNANSPIFLHTITGQLPFAYVEDGWLFWLYSQGITTNQNAFSAYPLAADFDFQADVNNRIICPKINLGSTPSSFYRILINAVQNLGNNTFGVTPDMYRVQYRTSGIDDNSGTWVDVPQNGDLSGVLASSNIQFAFQFRTAGTVMLPARILSLGLVYETIDSLPTQYRWNFNDFNTTTGVFAWIQYSTFGTLGTHTIEIYRADTNALVLTQASTGTTNGNFQYWDGSTWVNGLGSNTIGTRRRFVPSGSIPGSVDLYAKIIVA